MTATNNALQTIRDAHQTATGSWTGCEWTSEHTIWGSDAEGNETQTTVDAEGKTAAECKELAGDESTDEQKAWAAAAKSVAEIESNAAIAEEEGAAALEQAEAGDLDEALRRAKQAASAERNHGDAPTWEPLVKAIEAAIKARDDAESAE